MINYFKFYLQMMKFWFCIFVYKRCKRQLHRKQSMTFLLIDNCLFLLLTNFVKSLYLERFIVIIIERILEFLGRDVHFLEHVSLSFDSDIFYLHSCTHPFWHSARALSSRITLARRQIRHLFIYWKFTESRLPLRW